MALVASTTAVSTTTLEMANQFARVLDISADKAQLFLDLLKQAVPAIPAPSLAAEAKIEANTKIEKEKVRASKLEIKVVHDIWDEASRKYKIKESSHTTSRDDDEWVEYLFILRRQFDQKNRHSTEYVDIKSEELRDILREVLKDVRGISLREDKPTVKPTILFNYLSQLKAYQTSHKTYHLEHLIRFLHDHYASTVESLNALLNHGEISFKLLWALFPPNTLVYTTCPNSDEPRCLILDSSYTNMDQSQVFFQLDCRYLDYDGKSVGEASTSIGIPKFRGIKKISTLDIFPLEYHRKKEEVRSSLIARGRKFISLMGVHHRNYEGYAFYELTPGKPDKVYVESRAMIDTNSFKQNNPNYQLSRIHENSYRDTFTCSFGYPQDQPSSKINGITPCEIKEEDLLLCSPRVLGFSLRDKRWLEFAVAHIEEISWNPLPFECLMIPDKQKDLVRALAESYMIKTSEEQFDDFVRGKGQGLNILLHGKPGVGKTLTTEGLAEHLKMPLYMACAGELGTNSKELESKLPTILRLVRHWNAIFLLDEADVFLEKRSAITIDRNALVSVFLREVEYFKGIMFLTTNRVDAFDPAFQSRIHIALKYYELGEESRAKIWTAFLQRRGTTSKTNISSSEIALLAKKKLNGRQVKNAVRAAHALATSNKEPLSYKHIMSAVEVTEDFERDLHSWID